MLVRNLRSGVRLAVFARVDASAFRIAADQLVLLVAVWVGVAIACSYALTEPPQWFQRSAIEGQALTLMLILGFAWLAGRASANPQATLGIAVAYLSAEPTTWIGYTALQLGRDAAGIASSSTLHWGIWYAAQLWETAIAFRAARLVGGVWAPRAAAAATAFFGVGLWLAFAIPSDAWFLTDTWSAEVWEEEQELDVEGIYHAQPALVAGTLAALEPERPGVPDLYFVAFGADSTQNVFRSEVEFAAELMDRRFDTRGRSVVLLNHEETLWERPLASASNLADVLEGVAGILNPEEDVLLLYLTGHGSREHELSVFFPGLSLNSFGAERLDAMLDAAGISWRVVAVSACYSGGFIEPLRDERTLVLTAAADDRRSFGCSNESEFTYFGRALFADELTRTFSFVGAFEAARERIRARELAEEKTTSQPQMAAGRDILGKLAELERRLSLRASRLAAAGSGAPASPPEPPPLRGDR